MADLDQAIRALLDRPANLNDCEDYAETIRGVLDQLQQLDAHGDPEVNAITRDIRNVIAAELGIVPGDTSVPEVAQP